MCRGRVGSPAPAAAGLRRRGGSSTCGGRCRPGRGVALLEVVLALAVFFGVSIAVLGGLSLSLRSARQIREESQAADLAVTMLSEVQMGVYPPVDAGPTPFEDPDADWSWQIVTMPLESVLPGAELMQVTIIIRNTVDGYTYRLYQLLPLEEDTTGGSVPEGQP